MTTGRHCAAQPRDALGQFASRACPTTYRLLVTAPATADRPDPGQPNRTVLTVPRCPHGSFARWAARNCCAPGARRGR